MKKISIERLRFQTAKKNNQGRRRYKRGERVMLNSPLLGVTGPSVVIEALTVDYLVNVMGEGIIRKVPPSAVALPATQAAWRKSAWYATF